MLNKTISPERKSAELLAFEYWLRTGRRLIFEPEADSDEHKFNPYHDPENGRFTFAPGGSRLASNSSNSSRTSNEASNARSAPAKPAPKPRPSPAHGEPIGNVGALSAKYESRAGGNPGEVSNLPGDPGGVSYGSHQLATNTGTVGAFMASHEARQWVKEFHGLRPGTNSFSAKWRAVAAREPKAFGNAQDAYVARTHYDVAARKIKMATGYDLDRTSSALRQVTYSTAVQHGATGGPRVMAEAIRRTDAKMNRTDPRYEPTLINAVYDRRTEIYRVSEARYRKLGLRDKERVSHNVATIRFPKERADALEMLRRERSK